MSLGKKIYYMGSDDLALTIAFWCVDGLWVITL